jgi:p-cumate 2,3-dioxygenase alpha subunit
VEGLERLIEDDPERGVFRVHRSAFTSPQLLQLERERIFDRCWLYLGHESEVERPGDYVRRHVAGRPLFMVRGEDGVVRAFYNSCTHRGALVCRRDWGNAKVFQCFYHAWTFDSRGELIGVPDEGGYPPAFRREDYGLRMPPRLESYRGFVFVSFNPQVQPLDEYLAGAREYLDLVADQAEEGMRVIRGTHRFHIRANWKLLVENTVGDGYHFQPVHETFIQFVSSLSGPRGSGPGEDRGRHRSLGNGHAVTEYPAYGVGRPIASWYPFFGEEAKADIEAIRQRLVARHGPERAGRICEGMRNFLIFPNFTVLDFVGVSLRVMWPVRPDDTEVLQWQLVPREEEGERLLRRLDNFLTFQGPGGLGNPDDVEALESCQAGYAAEAVEWSDLSRGMHRQATSVDELVPRVFWRQWHAHLLGLPAAPRLADRQEVAPGAVGSP